MCFCRRNSCKEKADKRKRRLDENRNLVNFRRDISEVIRESNVHVSQFLRSDIIKKIYLTLEEKAHYESIVREEGLLSMNDIFCDRC